MLIFAVSLISVLILSAILFWLMHNHRQQQIETWRLWQESTIQNNQEARQQLIEHLQQQTRNVEQRLQQLNENQQQVVKSLQQQVQDQLQKGFHHTQHTFTDIVQRLTMIDAAQQKMNELSIQVDALRQVFSDKQSRGAWGEVQLSQLIKDIIPEPYCSFQHTLSNSKRADCVLFLPEPTGTLVIDAKFPLESYQKMIASSPQDATYASLYRIFVSSIKKHIQDIAEKYIIPGETSDGAVMFIPSEAIFAEVHGKCPELVALSHEKKVWMTSPTTLMAILSTARAVLKDAATKKELHTIQQQLKYLHEDFIRFQDRMDLVSKHIQSAQQAVHDVHTSSHKITKRFLAIEKVEL